MRAMITLGWNPANPVDCGQAGLSFVAGFIPGYGVKETYRVRRVAHMRIGIAFPTTEIGTDPVVIRDFSQAIEGMGYKHLTCIDHVVQEVQESIEDWRSYYSLDNMFHEPLTLFSFLAGVTESIEMATAILILPQRQTALVAKQAAEIDLLSGGRLRLGVGIGWNAMEYDVLGQKFSTRARRVEEQVAYLRQLWTRRNSDFSGEWHNQKQTGINPLPIQQPIPLWIGAFEDPAIRRAGRIADGWFLNPRVPAGNESARQIGVMQKAAQEAGRDPASIGIDVTLLLGDREPEELADELKQWIGLGATHVTVRTMDAGLPSIDAHLDVFRRVRDAIGDGYF